MAKARYDITAIIYDKKGMILSIGKNKYGKSHPMMAKLSKKVGLGDKIIIHAEIDAIIKCQNIDKAYRMRVINYSRAGEIRNAMPCPICQSGIFQTPIKIIEYSYYVHPRLKNTKTVLEEFSQGKIYIPITCDD